ncbi:MAG: ABC transporter ATP-binding protein [Verrucomicrobiales bacterium]|nr:ABC transporter ATP-binding protein [Verrucomicrobiales bacterium]MCP5525384.1 ABC transporter ATP-binding protein [Verrucomicrobiales bacterium]
MRVTIERVDKRFDRTPVLREISLVVEDHELFFLLGPSGCGKTTLLRLLAGFYEPDAGEVRFGDRRMNGVPPHRRNTGMVFQNYALWPHLTVAENVVYGLDVRRLHGAEKRRRVSEALEMVRMEAYRDRSPNQLSGGQQQRVALARALVVRPDVLLLDEPLSNLDAQLRLEMRAEIRRIHQQTRITTVYVTHDQDEALSMADRIAVMREGRLEQLGDPRTLYRRPVNRFVGDFIGECNWLEGEVAARDPDGMIVRTARGLWRATAESKSSPGEPVWVGFRPEAVTLARGTPNGFLARIEEIAYLGRVEQYRLSADSETPLKAVESNPVAPRHPAEEVPCHVAPTDLIVVPR